MEIQAKRMPCSLETKEDIMGANLMVFELAKMHLVLVVVVIVCVSGGSSGNDIS
jgi:hypothetical protein